MCGSGASTDDFAVVDLDVGRWRSTLSPEEAARGILAVHKNVRRLFGDAVVLLEAGKDASAVVLAILAFEEAAKALQVALIAGQDVGEVLRAMWKDFGNHDAKSEATLQLHAIAGSFPPDVRERIEAQDSVDVAKSYSLVRERATYLECTLGPERWSLPGRVISRELAITMLHAIFKGVMRIIPASQAIRGVASSESAEVIASPERLATMREYAEQPEVTSLSQRDMEDAERWGNEMRERLAKFPIPS